MVPAMPPCRCRRTPYPVSSPSLPLPSTVRALSHHYYSTDSSQILHILLCHYGSDCRSVQCGVGLNAVIYFTGVILKTLPRRKHNKGRGIRTVGVLPAVGDSRGVRQ